MNDGNETSDRFERAAASLDAPENPPPPEKPRRKYTIYEARRLIADTASSAIMYGPAVLSAALGPDTINEIHWVSIAFAAITATWWLPKGLETFARIKNGARGTVEATRICLTASATALTTNALTGLNGDAVQWTAWAAVATGMLATALTGLRALAAGGTLTLPNGEDPLG